MAKKFFWLFISFLLSIPFAVAYAQFDGQAPFGNAIPNPLKREYGDLAAFLNAIVDFLLYLAIPIAIFFVIYAGFLFVTAQGNEEQLKTAKKTIIWSLIGVAVLLGAKVIAYAIQGTISSLRP